jgi:hypothetical protein
LNDVLLAIESGKPVLCERPMGKNAGECRQRVEAARLAKLLLGVSPRSFVSNAAPRACVSVSAWVRWVVRFLRGQSFS